MRGVTKTYASGDGVRDLDMAITEGTIVGLIGPSGAGKTTMVRLLTGELAPSDGRVRVFDEDPRSFDRRMRSRLGYMPQLSVLYPSLTVRQNLGFFAAMYGLRGSAADRRARETMEIVDLARHADKRVVALSGGMRRRLSLAAALVHEPDLVFLDEPTAGIDPMLRQELWNRFAELRSSGTTLVLTTQYVGEASECDEVGLLAEGELVAHGSPDELRRAAFGGEVAQFEFEDVIPTERVERVRAKLDLPDWESRSSTGIRWVVEDAAAAIPAILEEFRAEGVAVVNAREARRSFDDVFVALIDAATDQQPGGGK